MYSVLCVGDAPHGRWLNGWRKSLTAITQECCEQYWTSTGDSTPQSSSYTATDHPSRKLSKLDEPDTWNTAGVVGTSSWVMYSCGPLHMDEQRQDVQLEPTYSSSVPMWNVARRIYWKQWTIGMCGERGSGISVPIVRHDDDDFLSCMFVLYSFEDKTLLLTWNSRLIFCFIVWSSRKIS